MSSDLPIWIQNVEVFSAANIATSANSTVVDLSDSHTFAVQITATGSPSATAQVQGSNDNVNWGSDGSSISISSAGTSITNFNDRGYRYCRIALTGGGTGTITAYISSKR